MVWHAGRLVSPALAAFLGTAREAFAGMGAVEAVRAERVG
jgi:hypothetical protein